MRSDFYDAGSSTWSNQPLDDGTDTAGSLLSWLTNHGPSWKSRGVCNGMDPALFFPERGDSTAEAKEACASCPVRQQCLEWALDHHEHFGIWGGTSERERRAIRRRRPRTPARNPNATAPETRARAVDLARKIGLRATAAQFGVEYATVWKWTRRAELEAGEVA